MEVDVWEFRMLDVRLVHVKHASWFVLRKLQRSGCRRTLGRDVDRAAYFNSRSCDQTHSIQPLTPTDHSFPPVIAQARVRVACLIRDRTTKLGLRDARAPRNEHPGKRSCRGANAR